MRIGSLTSAAHTALSGINRAGQQMQQVAETVAAGVQTKAEPGRDDFTAALTRLPEIRLQARANARVFETADVLLNELAAQPRR